MAGLPPAGERAPDSAGADDDPLHPVAAPISRMTTQASARPSRLIRLVPTVRPYGFRRDNDLMDEGSSEPAILEQAGGRRLSASLSQIFAEET